jgi:hypothetical protein
VWWSCLTVVILAHDYLLVILAHGYFLVIF